MTYLFYDIETTGLSKCFDQVLQFAAIRTDEGLKEIDRHEFRIKLNPDVIPSPKALLTTTITIEEALEGGKEFEAIKKIHQLMNEPGTMGVGYNSLGFDDEFLRFSFYRNLLPPYTHQYANGCGRMDLYPMTVMYYLFKPEIMEWPKIDGKTSLKLEGLSTANHLADGEAHNAMVDVGASVALARIFFKEGEMWHYLIKYFDKKSDLERIARLTPAFEANHYYHRKALYIKGSLGSERNYQCPVLLLGSHNHYKNQTLWLRLDTDRLRELTDENIMDTTRVIHRKNGEPGFLLPWLPKYTKQMSNGGLSLMEINMAWLQANPPLLKKIVDYYKEYTHPFIHNLDIDAALYQNGFLSPHEEQQCVTFHGANIEEKIKMIDLFGHSGLREQAIRIIARSYPEDLPNSYMHEFEDYLRRLNPDNIEDTIVDYRNQNRLTPKAACNEIDNLLHDNTLTERQRTLLKGLRDYLNI